MSRDHHEMLCGVDVRGSRGSQAAGDLPMVTLHKLGADRVFLTPGEARALADALMRASLAAEGESVRREPPAPRSLPSDGVLVT